MKVLVAADKFKGSLSSIEVNAAIRQGVMDAVPDCDVVMMPVADGGDGTAAALVDSLGGLWTENIVHGPSGKSLPARYGVINGDTVVVDVAAASGLASLDAAGRNPLITSTLGTGEQIKDAICKGYRKFMIGLGGSATNDAATGILASLGYRFVGIDGNLLFPCGKNLVEICAVDSTCAMPELKECRFTLLCDVDVRFYGIEGAAYVFAPQKGADEVTVGLLDDGLRSFANILLETTGVDVQTLRYAGAAGGIGGTLCSMLGADAVCGIDAVIGMMGFDDVVAGADIVVTGEGRMDATTLLGKAPYGVCKWARRYDAPVIAFTADVKDAQILNAAGFLAVFPIQSGVLSEEESMRPEVASANLRRTAFQTFRLISGLK
ncbi:MAG: glycerate kinase [Bacteroidetes bacterium]|uniref:Glycerate kinase n=1 Tax=Candidatus Limisoma faecipullorum TaxID=2840854 RepID=A0A9D9IQX2_9BACT|nr:glycerate kinase [Candidatus Limisoma faecipullorum]